MNNYPAGAASDSRAPFNHASAPDTIKKIGKFDYKDCEARVCPVEVVATIQPYPKDRLQYMEPYIGEIIHIEFKFVDNLPKDSKWVINEIIIEWTCDELCGGEFDTIKLTSETVINKSI
jgi:hypothetical protein